MVSTPDTIEIGFVLRAHGVRGELRVRLHNPGSNVLGDVDAVWLGDRRFDVDGARPERDEWLLRLAGVSSKEAADDLKGKPVSVLRDVVPVEEDEYLVGDLVGCAVVDETLGPLGTVTALVRGAQDLIVLRDDRVERMVPLVDELIVEVDTRARRVLVRLPDEWPEDPI